MWSVATMDRVLYIVNKVCGVDVFLYVLDGFQTEGYIVNKVQNYRNGPEGSCFRFKLSFVQLLVLKKKIRRNNHMEPTYLSSV